MHALLYLFRPTRMVVVARLMALVLVATFTVPAFGGACCSGADLLAEVAAPAAPEADDCCPDDAESHDTEENGPCPCPFPCATGCAGQLGRVLVQVTEIALVPPACEVAPPSRPEFVAPTNPDPRDILHVPKRLGA
jgi:hypothetical protein